MKTLNIITAGLVCLLVLLSSGLFAQSPVISIQGTLKDANGASVADGMRQVTFRLYNSPTGGNALWTEVATIEVVGGIYSHNLGRVQPLSGGNFSTSVFLSVEVAGNELLPRTEMTYAPYALSVNSAQQIARGGCSGQVGDIKHSILTPTQFAVENGDCWVPMDGRGISGTRLATIMGSNTVPDMSGLFIRATEYTGNNDPGRSPNAQASYQADGNKSHSHGMNVTGGHQHTYEDSYFSFYDGSAGSTIVPEQFRVRSSLPRSGAVTFVGASHAPFLGLYSTQKFENTVSEKLTPTAGAHNHTIAPDGNTETTVKNRNFFIYIRVD
jgi:hypothetical protein